MEVLDEHESEQMAVMFEGSCNCRRNILGRFTADDIDQARFFGAKEKQENDVIEENSGQDRPCLEV